jgi:hypothetical protein
MIMRETVYGTDSNHPRFIDEVKQFLSVDVAVEVFEEKTLPHFPCL